MTRLLLTALCTAVPSAAWAQADSLRFETSDASTAVAAATHLGHPSYPLAALRHLGAALHAGARDVTVIFFGDTLRFELHSPVFFDGARPVQLAAPIYLEAGSVYAPRQLFTEWLPGRFAGRLAYRAGALRFAGTAAEAAAALAAAAEPAARPARAMPRERVVVLDPGHGGRDPGKIGPTGIREKDVTLAVALALESVLLERGHEVHLTRRTDVLIPLAQRPRMANRWRRARPALFISLHANSGRPHARGFETFFLSEARTEDERRVAEIENAAVRYENGDDAWAGEIDLILNNLRNTFYQRASNDLAEVVQRGLASFHPGPDRGVKQAGFRVLLGALMPAVLVEIGFISNLQEARLLASESFRQRIAEALADSVDDFFRTHGHLLVAESEP